MLNKSEGYLAGLLPKAWLGQKNKPTGAPGDPLHVIMAGVPDVNIPFVPQGLSTLGMNSLGGNPLGNQQSLFSGLFSSSSTDAVVKGATSAASGAGSVISGISNLASFLPGFATGTEPLSQGTWAMVGEEGPEFTLYTQEAA